MRYTEQMRLSDFDESLNPKPDTRPRTRVPTGRLWERVVTDGEWGVCKFDDTVLFVQIINGRPYAYGHEAICKWCGDPLEIRGEQVFCSGHCGRYQGKFSRDLNAFLHWNGAESRTVRHELAQIEGLVLEPRDLEPIVYHTPTPFYVEYEEDEQ